MLSYTCLHTAWGYVAFAATAKGVRGLVLPVPTRRRAEQLAARRWPDGTPNPRLMTALQQAIRGYFLGRRVRFDVPLDLSDLTDFQQAVLRACAAIPYGCTMSYGRLAAAMGRPTAARAVGGVMARNPIPLIIPCHRVMGADGRLTGFSAEGGIGVKRRMLQLEGALPR